MILPDRTFELENFTTLETQIIEDLKDVFCIGIPICDLYIIGFRQGSVIVDFLVAIATGADPCVVISQMNNLPATIGGINVLPGIFSTGKLALSFLDDKEWLCHSLCLSMLCLLLLLSHRCQFPDVKVQLIGYCELSLRMIVRDCQ